MTSDWKDLHSLDVFIWSEIEWAFSRLTKQWQWDLARFSWTFRFCIATLGWEIPDMGNCQSLNLTFSCGESQRLRWSFNRAHRAHVRNRLVLLRGTFRASGHLLSETQDFKPPLWSKRRQSLALLQLTDSQTLRRSLHRVREAHRVLHQQQLMGQWRAFAIFRSGMPGSSLTWRVRKFVLTALNTGYEHIWSTSGGRTWFQTQRIFRV